MLACNSAALQPRVWRAIVVLKVCGVRAGCRSVPFTISDARSLRTGFARRSVVAIPHARSLQRVLSVSIFLRFSLHDPHAEGTLGT